MVAVAASSPMYAAINLAVDVPGASDDRGSCPRARSVYSMRMARVNITVPDELLEHAREAGLNVSRLASAALAEELDRRAKIAALDAYLAEMDAEFGPVPDADRERAAAWADGLLAARPAGRRGTRSRQARTA